MKLLKPDGSIVIEMDAAWEHYGPGQPWDDHKEIERNLRERGPNMGKASAALIRDLKRRGQLDETLVA